MGSTIIARCFSAIGAITFVLSTNTICIRSALSRFSGSGATRCSTSSARLAICITKAITLCSCYIFTRTATGARRTRLGITGSSTITQCSCYIFTRTARSALSACLLIWLIAEFARSTISTGTVLRGTGCVWYMRTRATCRPSHTDTVLRGTGCVCLVPVISTHSNIHTICPIPVFFL